MKKTDLILHPIRLQILSTLSGAHLSTQEIAERLYNIPISTIYRHMRVLSDANLIKVAETRLVKGTEEKIYQLVSPAHLGPQDMTNISKEQHTQYFLSYILSLLDDFSRYIEQNPKPDLVKDFVGYNDLYLYVNEEELKQLGSALQQALAPFAQNEPVHGRHLHKLSIITHPETKEISHD